MAYTVTNFKIKKALKEAVLTSIVLCYQPGLGPDLSDYTGTVHLEGSHYPKAHTWYASAELRKGAVITVK